ALRVNRGFGGPCPRRRKLGPFGCGARRTPRPRWRGLAIFVRRNNFVAALVFSFSAPIVKPLLFSRSCKTRAIFGWKPLAPVGGTRLTGAENTYLNGRVGMTKPFSVPDSLGNGVNGMHNLRSPDADPHGVAGEDLLREVEHLRAENEELRGLVLELEQALQGAGQVADQEWENRAREYEAMLEEKSDLIRNLHRRLSELEEAHDARGGNAAAAGSGVREQELLALSEELERERRQIKEDEDALMEQMREM